MKLLDSTKDTRGAPGEKISPDMSASRNMTWQQDNVLKLKLNVRRLKIDSDYLYSKLMMAYPQFLQPIAVLQWRADAFWPL